jgi:hypothetical protein
MVEQLCMELNSEGQGAGRGSENTSVHGLLA